MLPKSPPADPQARTARSRQQVVERFVIGLLFATMLIRVVLICDPASARSCSAWLGR